MKSRDVQDSGIPVQERGEDWGEWRDPHSISEAWGHPGTEETWARHGGLESRWSVMAAVFICLAYLSFLLLL